MAIKSVIGEKSLAFGKRIAKCYRYLRYSKREHILSDQLDIIHIAEYLNDDEYDSLKSDNDEIIRLLVSIIKTTKANDSNP